MLRSVPTARSTRRGRDATAGRHRDTAERGQHADATGPSLVAEQLDEQERPDREHAENANLRLALTSRSVIDQAIGILVAQQQCSVEAAFELLRKASQGRNIKLREVAAQIVAGAQRRNSGKPAGRY
jgi:predicted transcriptional regulator